ncbi:hypothetical protein RV15_GL000555 [Enterococcus silesiacus]|nr:MucBP domain-containing protein [Enterococcus silesiacus]OJG91671.1 hypothetical protein RV15_GL000555 [Enterococcus silesiacus]
MVVGQNIGGITAFAETLSLNNNGNAAEELYLKKDNEKLEALNLEEGEEAIISLVDSNVEDVSVEIILPENVEYINKESENNVGMTINYDNQSRILHVDFLKSNDIKVVTFMLKAIKKDTSVNKLYAQANRGEVGLVHSEKVEVQVSPILEATDSDSIESEETINSSNEVLDDPQVQTSSSEKEDGDSAAEQNTSQEQGSTRAKRSVESRANLDNNIPAPPASNMNVLDYFEVPNLGNSSNAAFPNQDYPQSVTITPNEQSKFGVMWAKNVIDLNEDFSFEGYVYLNNKNGKNADGMAFVLQNDPRGTTAYGSPGWGLGVYGGRPGENPSIKNALSFELDTWYNGRESEINTNVYENGKNNTHQNKYDGHLAVVETNRDISANLWNNNDDYGLDAGRVKHNNVIYGTSSNPVNKDKWQSLNIKWDSKTKTFSFKLDTFPELIYSVKDINDTFGGNLVRFGFTGSTGDVTENNLVSFNKLPVAPVNVFYKDIDTNEEISDSELLTGKLGDSWKSEQKDIDQYEFVTVDKKTDGIFTQTAQEVTYFYRKLLPKLDIAKSVDKTIAKVGDELTYTITAKNSGEGSWNGTITDKIPAEYVSLVSGTTTINEEKVADETIWKDNVLNVTQTVEADGQVEIKFTMKVTKDAKGQTIANVAETDDPTIPPTPPVETKVPDVSLTKTADKANAKVGEEITYTITAKNSGNGDWENGTITDKIPVEYVSLVSGTTTINGEKVADETIWKDNVLNVTQTIEAGGTVEIKFTVKAIEAAKGQTIANVAETDDLNTPPTPPAATKVPNDPVPINNNIKKVTHLPRAGENGSKYLIGMGIVSLLITAYVIYRKRKIE